MSTHQNRVVRIFLTNLQFNFNSLTELECLLHFTFRRKDTEQFVVAIGWPSDKKQD